MHRIEINQDKACAYGTTVKVDDRYLSGIRGVDYNVSTGEAPQVTLDIAPEAVNIDVLAKTGLTISIDSIRDAIKCIQFEMKLNKEFKDAMIASVESVIKERIASDVIVASDLSEAIIDRIFFGDL